MAHLKKDDFSWLQIALAVAGISTIAVGVILVYYVIRSINP